MVTLLKGLLCGACALLLIPATVLFSQVVLAVTRRATPSVHGGERKSVAVIVPAHNESAIIASALRSVVPQLNAMDRLIVVADNCSDDTDKIAACEGATVIVRSDPARRGKGYALDFGVRHLERAPPDIVIVIDADCLLAAGALDVLAQQCTRTSRPSQALYLMHSGRDAPLRTRMAEFAWVVKNRVRPEGMQRLELPCQLMGTGMAFPWLSIREAQLATGHIAEDLKLGIELSRNGMAPLFCPEAVVTSQFPTSLDGALVQRTRWEHGHLSLILSDAPRLFVHSLFPPNIDAIALALDLCVPPLALLILQVGSVWCLSLLFYALTHAFLPLAGATLAACLIVLSVLLSWRRYGRKILSLGQLLLGVIYPLLKIPLYARFVLARQLEWVRSKRDEDQR